MTPTDKAAPKASRRGRRSALEATCRACGGPLTSGAERKLARHRDCEPTYDEALWEALRAWRKETADAVSAPAFVIFTDATLMAIAERTPTTSAELATIAGVGATKLARYGADVLAIVAAHQS